MQMLYIIYKTTMGFQYIAKIDINMIL